MKKILSIFLAGIVSISCHKNKSEESIVKDYVVKDSIINVNQSSPLVRKLKLSTIKEEVYKLKISSTGNIKAIPNLYTIINPPYTGRITKVFLKLGMKVSVGTPLFEMTSSEFSDIQKNYYEAKTELGRMEVNLKRQKDLKKHGLISTKELQEVQASYEIALQELKNSEAALKMLNVNARNMTLGQALVITSPINGEVLSNTIISGSYVKEDTDVQATIAQLQKVWVIGLIKEKDIRFIHQSDDVEISVAAFPNRLFKGHVSYIDGMLDEDTRSLKVIIECENKDTLLKPGMFATLNFSDHEEEVIRIPSSSIFQMGEDSYVFVKKGINSYCRRKIKTGVTESHKTLVTYGINSGETIITEGGYYLLEAQ